MTVIVKVGTSLILDNEEKINKIFISELCRQVWILRKNGYSPIIVTSGAVHSDQETKRSKNLRAAVGQPRLMSYYLGYLGKYDIVTSQHLLIDEDLVSGRIRVTEKTISEALSEGIVPVINGNDPVDDEETNAMEHSADNDKLFMLVCKLVKPSYAVIGFDQEGIMDNNGKIVRVVNKGNFNDVLSYAKGGSEVGHGDNGMKTKIEVLNELANAGIKSILAPGKTNNFLIKAINRLRGGKKDFGTIFLP